jgi:hypothetical protein
LPLERRGSVCTRMCRIWFSLLYLTSHYCYLEGGGLFWPYLVISSARIYGSARHLSFLVVLFVCLFGCFVRVVFRFRLGSVRVLFGVCLGSVRGLFGVCLGSVWGPFGVYLGSVRDLGVFFLMVVGDYRKSVFVPCGHALMIAPSGAGPARLLRRLLFVCIVSSYLFR